MSLNRTLLARLSSCVLLALLSGCGLFSKIWNFGEDSEASTAAVFEAINQEDYGAIHGVLSRDLQEAMDLDVMGRMFGELRREAGICEAPGVVSYRVNSSGAGTIAVLVVRADCENGVVQADVTWQLEQGEPRLAKFSFLREVASSTPGN